MCRHRDKDFDKDLATFIGSFGFFVLSLGNGFFGLLLMWVAAGMVAAYNFTWQTILTCYITYRHGEHHGEEEEKQKDCA